MCHLFCHRYFFAVVYLLVTENACPRLLQVAEIFLQDVVCLTSRSLLFSFNLHMVKRKYRFLRHDLLLRRVIWTSFGCSASSLFADHVTNPCFLTSGYSDTDKCTCAVHHAGDILAFSIRGAQWPRPKSTQCSSCSSCDPQTYCLSWGGLAVTSRGLTWPSSRLL